MDRARWELGSLFDLARWSPGGRRGRVPWDQVPAQLFGTGRGAMVATIGTSQIARLWVPSYLCQEVVAAAAATGIELRSYVDGPDLAAPELDPFEVIPGDGILVVDYFGLRAPWRPEIAGTVVIEDHTHAPCSPWALESTADYCVASLRKLFPLADGGVVWSARRPLPARPPLADALARASADKLSGMVLKRLYLDGHEIDKPGFRAVLAAGEQRLYRGAPSAITPVSDKMLAAFPLASWRQRRRECFEAFERAVGDVVTLYRPVDPEAVPFSALLELPTVEARDALHVAACGERVYPSRLWPLDEPILQVPERHRDLSRRLLSIPLDMRYTPADLERAGRVVAVAAQSS